jgi:hypothetical protein
MLLQIDVKYRSLTLVALEFLCFSGTPLNINELAEAVALRPKTQPLEFPDRFFDPEDIRVILSSLVSLEENGVIRLAHYSVQEYLLSERIRTGPVSHFGLDESLAHLHIAERCLTYLLAFASPGSLRPQISDQYPFLDYAARHWHKHTDRALQVYGDMHHGIKEMVLDFCNTGSHMAFANTIRIADLEGLVIVGAELFDFQHEISEEDVFELGSPLYHACAAGCSHIVKLLLADGMPLLIPDGGIYSSALNVAVFEQHVEIVQTLLKESDIGVSGKDDDTFTPLWLAVQAGSEELVHLLLDAGADVNVETDHEQDRTALGIAASRYTGLASSLYFAELLLHYGAETGLLDNRQLVLIQTAAKSVLPHEDYAETLLDVIVAADEMEEKKIQELALINPFGREWEILLVKAVVCGKLSQVRRMLHRAEFPIKLELWRALIKVAENRSQETSPDMECSSEVTNLEDHKELFEEIANLLRSRLQDFGNQRKELESSQEQHDDLTRSQ